MNPNDKTKLDELKLRLSNAVDGGGDSGGFDDDFREMLLDAIEVLNDFESILGRQDVGDGYKYHILAFFDTLSANISGDSISRARYSFGSLDPGAKAGLKVINGSLIASFKSLKFDYALFKKIGFGRQSTVIIGANGSGKSTLSSKLKMHMGNSGVSISAQRVLLIPQIDTISNPGQTLSHLRSSQVRDKTNKDPQEFKELQGDFGVALKHLIAENISTGTSYRAKALECQRDGKEIPDPPKTKLDRTIEIWNDLIPQRVLLCSDSMNILVGERNGDQYPASRMSDGEKVLLFLIAQVLQAPINGFVIIDEPEIHLHKSILGKIWDTLEREREDCVFIYLTHDLNFASSRKFAGKIWIKSYAHPHDWDIQEVPENDIPEALRLELIGSRKDILFCEGNRGSLDFKIYSKLFSQLTVVPVSSCGEVMSYTRAFNRQTVTGTKAIGVIDSDFSPVDRSDKLRNDGVYLLGVSEVENLLLDERFLGELAKNTLADFQKVEAIKIEIIKAFKSEIHRQAAMYVSAKIDSYFKESNVPKGGTVEEIEENLALFNRYVDVGGWYEERVDYLKAVAEEGYESVIRVFNHKGLKAKVMQVLEIGDFEVRALKTLNDTNLVDYLRRRYFHSDLSELN